MASEAESISYEFDSFRIDAGKRLLFDAAGEPILLTPKVFDTLLYLVANNGKVIEKDELMSAIWTDTIVEENNLNKNISVLRRILGENPGEHRFIVTVPGKGYKFVAEARTIANNGFSESTNIAITDQLPASELPKFRFVFAASLGVILIAAILAGSYYWRNRETSVSIYSTKTIAILPFRPLVAENRDEAFELGMADTLISRLGNNREIIVRPLSSVRSFGGLEQDAVEAGKALDVESILDGNIQRWGDRIRVNVRLVKVADGTMLWTDTFDEKFTDIFVVHDAISSRVAKALAFRLSGDGQKHLTKRNTENLEAYQIFLKGRYHMEKFAPQDSRRAIAYFQQAIALDPKFAAAYAHLAGVYAGVSGAKDFPRRETIVKARENALKAVSLDDQLSTAHEVYGYILFNFDYNFVAAEREFKRALELDPNDASAHETYGGLLASLGRHDESLTEVKQAAEINPLSPSISGSHGNSLLSARRYDEAIAQYKKALELDAYFINTHYGLAVAYQMQRNYAESVEERAKFVEIMGDPQGAAFIRESFVRGGWQGFLREMTENSQAPQPPPFVKATLYAELGEKDKAFAILNSLYEEGSPSLVRLKFDPRFDPLRGDPRFAEIIKRLNLE